MSIDSERDGAAAGGLDSLPAGEFLRAAPDATVTVGLDGTVTAANPAVERVLGYAPAAIVDESVTRLVPERFTAAARELAAEYVETGRSPVGTTGLELYARHADGHEVPVSVTLVEHEHAGEPVVSAVAREITDRVDREAELVRDRERFANALDAIAGEPSSERVSLPDICTAAWGTVETGAEELETGPMGVIETDPDRLRALVASLFAATAPLDGTVEVHGDDDSLTVSGAAVASDLGAAPALANAMGVELDRDVDAVTVTF